MSKATRKQDVQAAMLSDLTGMVQRLLGVPEQKAHHLAQQLYTDMRRQWGGRQVHFHAMSTAEQADRILAAWRGDNVAEVCACFGISRSVLYRVLAMARRAKNPKTS
jgi:Mor family transcriptional regulator